ncbi:FAS1-like dehydratase domain-containing protein [Noviherbaspirillum malthae]|uniref:FAS1-like dehydratase domain-containing protein n=1 Tax=Noviherbaspirillum malthae TaxID=1260987 RepID=UPI00189077CF|nr:MaoC family dehydratase N-terminal domain-containing protein [Noviherbaspirillum malthae]
MTSMLDLAHLQQWIGKSETRTDTVTEVPCAAMAATMDMESGPQQPGDAIAPLWHWLYFLPLHRQSELGEDGHAKRGGFLPPVPLPRRMWAGGRLQFLQDIRVGDAITRTSRIVKVDAKEGKTGPLVFVLVRHEIAGPAGLAIVEEHDIVYRGMSGESNAAVPKGIPAPQEAAWTREINADAVMLFRYSALTFNGHRIHYDRSYTTGTEGYPGLIVHGPLIATLLLDLLRRQMPGARVAGFRFKAVSPLFDTAPFQVCGMPSADGKTVSLWAKGPDGMLAMEATATLDASEP